MTLHAKFLSERRKAQQPPDPRHPLGIVVDGTKGRLACSVSLEYPSPCVGKWLIQCDTCDMVALVTAAGRVDDPHTVRLPCKPKGSA